MIVNNDDLINNISIDADLCIIGGGPAGISIALELENSGLKIVLLGGGRDNETAAYQDLNKGIVVPSGSHEPLEENRRRAFGGASIAWGGRCIPLDPIDFEKREWIPNSGWPFSYQNLLPYYKRANVLCKAGDFNYNAHEVFPNGPKEIIENLDNEMLSSNHLERWSTPVNFAKDYKGILTESKNIHIIKEANATKINSDTEKGKISSVYALIDNKKIIIRASKYVLAAGGIENPRLLLASKNRFHPHGMGNDNDNVGRYYQAHFSGVFVEVSPKNRKNIVFDFEEDNEKVSCRRRWWVTSKAQEEHKIGNAIFFLHGAKNQDGHRDSFFSIVFVAKFFVSVIKDKSIAKSKAKWKKEKDAILAHGAIILKEGWSQIPKIIIVARKRLRKRRLPFVLPSINSNSLGLYFQTEQMPNPHSRITISKEEFDSTGVPRAVVNIAFTDVDKKTILKAHSIFMERFKGANIGDYKFNLKDLSRFIDQRMQAFNSGAHHIGCTRIHEDPKLGVVDANCKVHGLDNLFIAGSSVFPTGGHVNPTLTIVALAVRLAEFIKKDNLNRY